MQGSVPTLLTTTAQAAIATAACNTVGQLADQSALKVTKLFVWEVVSWLSRPSQHQEAMPYRDYYLQRTP